MQEQVFAGEQHKAQWLELIPPEHRIERVSAQEFFDSHFSAKKPCIIEGLQWQCMQWKAEKLREEFSQYEHLFRYGDGEAEEKRTTLKIPLADYISQLFVDHDVHAVTPPTSLPKPDSRTEQVPYARHIGPLRGRLSNDVDVESLFPPAQLRRLEFRKFLFVGPPKTKTNNHYDWSDNFSLCVAGIKHVALMPPKSEQQMSNIAEDLRAQLQDGDCFFVDDGALQLDLTRKKSSEIAMHQHDVLSSCEKLLYSPLFPGDMVFFPSYWFHYFHNYTSTISVTVQTHSK